MRRDLIALVFKTTSLARELNIGDTVLLSHRNNEYTIWDGTDRYGYQSFFANDEVDSLLSYLSHQRDARIVIWDEEYSRYLDDTMVEVASVTNNYVIVIPNNEVQTLLSKELDEKRERRIADDLASIEDYILSAMGDECGCVAGPEGICGCPSGEEMCVEEKKEETNMFSEIGSSFGKINSDQFRLSINGLAVKGKDGKYVTFSPDTRELVEVTTGFFDEMKDLLFVMPATELEVGDIILHQNKPYYITANGNNVKGIDFEDAVESIIIPKTNVFGMKYFTKVFNCLGTNNILGSDLTSNPMMAYALMGGKDFDLSKIMMFQALSGQGNGIADFSENPIMLMALMSNENGGGDLSNFAKMQVLSQIAGNKKKETKKVTKEN